MSTSSIFVFDHGQKKLNKAIGVSEDYLEDLQDKIKDVLKDYLFDENKNLKDDLSPSQLVEASLHEFSYNQLVLISSLFLQKKLEEFAEKTSNEMNNLTKSIHKIAIKEEDIPLHIKNILINLMKDGKGDSKLSAINGDDLPDEVKKFLDELTRNQKNDDGDDD
jgi:hypothetical protein